MAKEKEKVRKVREPLGTTEALLSTLQDAFAVSGLAEVEQEHLLNCLADKQFRRALVRYCSGLNRDRLHVRDIARAKLAEMQATLRAGGMSESVIQSMTAAVLSGKRKKKKAA